MFFKKKNRSTLMFIVVAAVILLAIKYITENPGMMKMADKKDEKFCGSCGV